MNIFRRREGCAGQDGEKEYKWRDGVYLCTINDTLTADIYQSKLRSEGIPSELKYIGSSNYLGILFGSSNVGEIEIYVPEECLEDAKNIIIPVDLEDCITDTEED